MAVDTRDKRFSMMGLNGPVRAVLPNPDGGFASQADRQQLVYLYSGLAAGAAATANPGVKLYSRSRQFRKTSRGMYASTQMSRSNARGPAARTASNPDRRV